MRIGYVVMRDPRHSETFIVQEILEVRIAGLDYLADGPALERLADPEGRRV